MTEQIEVERVKCNRGTDFVFPLPWIDTDDEPVNLSTGYTVHLMEVSASISEALTIEITDAVDGIITVRLPWNDTYLGGEDYFFRVQLQSSGAKASTNLFQIVYV